MEPVLTGQMEPAAKPIAVNLESVVTVPSEHAELLVAALRDAGIEAWDTGERTTTEDAIDALADLRVRVPLARRAVLEGW